MKTPADFGGDKAGNDDDEDGSDDAGEIHSVLVRCADAEIR